MTRALALWSLVVLLYWSISHVNFCAIAGWRSTLRHRSSSIRGRITVRGAKHDFRIALLLDGDCYGPRAWAALQATVRARGALVQSYVFASPGSTRRWTGALNDLNIKCIDVPRATTGAKDPNDIAMSVEAARIVFQSEASAIALAVKDADFVYLAARLKAWGFQVVALIQKGSQAGLARAFSSVNAEIAWYQLDDDRSQNGTRIKAKAVLHSDGSGSIQPMTADDHWEFMDVGRLLDVLKRYQYISNEDDPIVPAIAKFYHANGLGPLTVWPSPCARGEAMKVLSTRSNTEWLVNPANLVFVLPTAATSKTKLDLQKYGTGVGAQIAKGGGPFIVKDTDNMCIDVLSRLGFLDDDLNDDVGEAIDVFCSLKTNRRNLAATCLRIPDTLPVHTKMFTLHAALVSSRLHENWQIAPRDTSVREYLRAKGLISRAGASRTAVFNALGHLSKQHGLADRVSYNGRVMQLLEIMNRGDPSRRR